MDNKLDGMCRVVLEKSGPNGAVSWFLMTSLLYYHLDVSVISDELYDELAKTIDTNWDSITQTQKWLIGRDALRAGTCYHLKIENYPRSVRGGAFSLVTGRGYAIPSDKRSSVYDAPFVPPDYCWETYRYGADGRTWVQHQRCMVQQWQEMISAGKLDRSQASLMAAEIGITDDPFTTSPEDDFIPTVRIRKRVRVSPEEAAS